MNIRRLMLPALILAGSLSSTVQAESFASAASIDPVSASFQRLLAHEPVRSAPVVPPALGDDPLRGSLCAVLWEKQGPSFHIPQRPAPRQG